MTKSATFNLNASANDIIEEITEALEDTVKNSFEKSKVHDRNNKSSRNLIPGPARTLMKRKLNCSRTLSKTTDPVKVKELKDKIMGSKKISGSWYTSDVLIQEKGLEITSK